MLLQTASLGHSLSTLTICHTPQVHFTGGINFPNLYTKIVELKHILNYDSCKKNSKVGKTSFTAYVVSDSF